MTILALDTTSECGSLAIRSGGQTAVETAIHAPEGFAHLLFPAIERLLAGAEVRLADIDCFAAAAGPGSFTGVRIGLSAVKGLAAATGKPAAGISNLRAVSSFGNSPLRAVTLDARRGDVYAAVYDADLEPVGPEAVLRLADWLQTLGPASGYEFISQSRRSLAPAVALCAELDGLKGRWQDPAALDANYVRRSDAELFWKEP